MAAMLAVVLLAGCTVTTATTKPTGAQILGAGSELTAKTVDPGALAEAIKKTFLTDVPVSRLDPVIVDALAVASQPLTPEQNRLFEQCIEQNSCDTGRGSLTVGLALEGNNSWTNIFRGEATAQAIASPQVARIIYSNGNSNIATVLANLRSMITQQVDIIVTDPVFGPTVLPVLEKAKRAGITVVSVNTPLPESAASSLSTQIPNSLCALYTDGAQKLVDALGPNNTYALYTGLPGNSNAAEWQPCAKKVLDGAGWTQVVEGFTQWTSQGEAQEANSLVASGKNPTAILYDYSVDDFLKPYVAKRSTPPAMMTDAANHSWFAALREADAAGVEVKSWLASGHVWFGRFGVTAAIKIRQGEQLADTIPVHIPTVPTTSILDATSPAIPAAVPISSLLTPEQLTWALAAA
ncbi:hypothetical protein B1790_32870 [Mycobacterium sp. AT1]|nr:hypothetical protein B1790_32870 [Mycobacterium sp. AT1]